MDIQEFTPDITQECQLNDESQFQAVWARVMAGKPNPILVGRAKNPAPTTQTATKTHTNPNHPNALPDYACFTAQGEEVFLQEALTANAHFLEEYGKLEKQLPQKLKPTLMPLYQQRKKQGNQLETAYFLLMGAQWAYPMPLHAPLPADQRLRQMFQQSQQWQSRFQRAAFDSGDSCLTTLYLQLESQLKEEVKGLHALVEGVFWLKHQ